MADNHYNFQEVLHTSADWATVANVLHTQHLNLQNDPLEILSSDYEYVGVMVNGFEIGRPPGFARRAYAVDDDPLNENDEGLADVIDYAAVLGHGSDLVPANNSAPAVGANVHRIHDHSIAMRLDFVPLLDVVGAHESTSDSTDDQDASEVDVDATQFSRNLGSGDTDVQAALETIDGFTQFQGAWQQASWPAGVIVTRSGIAYISLVNNNTQIPTPASTQWSGLPEGFVYRGEAPVAATNYNYGQVVLDPGTGVYYYFTSTISASVARADIAGHANFQPISGETGHAPRVDSGNAFPTTPAPVDNDIFFFDADVASGLDWKDTDGTTDLTAATGGDMARFDGTDWIKVINLVGGGGAADPDRVVLVDAVAVSNAAGPHEIALTQAIEPRQWLTFFMFTTAGASPDGIGYLLSDDILALTPEATTPTDAENALPVVTASYSASNFSQQSGNYFVYRKDDSTLWVRPTRLAAHALTITATPMGGSDGTAGQLAGGLTEQVIVGSRIATTEYGIGTVWTSVIDAISPTISPAIDPANLLYISVLLRIDTAASIEVFISGAAIRRIVHTADPLPSDAVSSDEIPGAYYSSRVPAGNADRGVAVNPTLSWMEARRTAGRFGVLFAFTDNAAGELTSIRPYVSANTEIDIDYIVAVIGA